jgi:periplasmic divalent cation tolerance protein
MSSFVIVLTTFPAEGNADVLARMLIDERLAACVNILPPMQSIYRWEGKVDDATERQLIIKTAASRVDALKQKIADVHPYELPEFVVIPILDGSEKYLGWLSDSTRTP